jgi:hypothetical protein
MDFWSAILGLTRRKLVIIPILGSAIAIALAGYFLTPLHYVSTATMVLVTPRNAGTLSQDPARPTGLTNPMLSFGNGLETAAAILIYSMNTREAAAELGVVKGGPTEVTIDDGRSSPALLDANGPFIYVAGKSPAEAEAYDVVVRAQNQMRQELIDRQRLLDAPPETYLTLVDVVAPTAPEVSRAARIKVSSIAFAMSLVFGLGVAYGWHYVLPRRRLTAGESSLTLEDNKRGFSLVEDGRDDPDIVAEEWTGDRQAARSNAELSAGERPAEAVKRYPDSGADAKSQTLDAGQATDGEQESGDDESTTGSQHSAERELVNYALHQDRMRSQGGRVDEVWDLYIVEYPAADGSTAPTAEDDEMDRTVDWSIYGLESERDSVVLGSHRRG